MIKLLCAILLGVSIINIQCSLQEKLNQASEKISTLRQEVKTGKDILNNAAKCGGSKCCGNSCGRCGKEH